jgi:rhamnosyltransferase
MDLKSHYSNIVQGASTIFNNSLKEQIYLIENVYLHDRYTHLVAEIMGRRFYLNKPLTIVNTQIIWWEAVVF